MFKSLLPLIILIIAGTYQLSAQTNPPDTVPVPLDDVETVREIDTSSRVVVRDSELTGEDIIEEAEIFEDFDSLIVDLNIENDDDYSSFSMLDSVLSNYRVFFVGENHQFRHSNQKIHLKMMKYLYYKAGVRTLILEFGVSSGMLMNDYVQTGDTALFKIFEDYAYKSWVTFIKDLCEWNLSLDSNDRIHVVGIDVERFQTIPLKVLSLYLPKDKVAPAEISLSIESLLSMVTYLDTKAREDDGEGGGNYFWSLPTYDVDNHVEALLKEYKENKEVFRAYIGEERFPLFDTVMASLRDHKLYEDYLDKRLPQGPIYRERYMHTQFSKLVHSNPDMKFFGQFGRCHVGTRNQEEACDWYNFNSIAQRIHQSNDTLINGKVCSIATFYPKSESFREEASDIRELRSIARQSIDKEYAMLEVNPDDKRFGKLSEMYNFIIINNREVEEEEAGEEDVVVEFDEEEDEENVKVLLSANYSWRLMDLADLSTTLEAPGFYKPFSNIMPMYGFEVGYYFSSIYMTLETKWAPNQEFLSSDGAYTMQSLKYSSSALAFGFANLENTLHYNMQFDFRYEAMGLNMLELNSFGLPRLGFYGEPIYSDFRQDAFVLGISGGLGIGIGDFMFLDGYVGFGYDLSRQQWKNVNNSPVIGIPSTSLTSYTAGIKLGFLIPINSGAAESPTEDWDL